MKQRAKQLLVWMWFMLPLIASAQSALNEHYNVPRPGDRLIKQQVLHKSPGRSGNSVCWDFSDLKVTDTAIQLLKRYNHDAHEIKHEFLGKKANIDLYKDTKTNEILIMRKGGVGNAI